MGSVLLEALIVTAVGLVIALGANGLRADGLQLERDYFPQSVEAHPATDDAQQTPAVAASVDTPAEPVAADRDGLDADVVARLAAKNLVAVGHQATVALWRDPMFQEYEATLFLDARREEQYADGHIPGARHFDPFYPERFLDELLPLLPSAMMIVVYCAGGECDDSESAALFLLNLGAVDPSQLSIYAGGMHAWKTAGLPVERGERGSGDMIESDEQR